MKQLVVILILVPIIACKQKPVTETVNEQPQVTTPPSDTLIANTPDQTPPGSTPIASSSTLEAVDSITATPPNADAKPSTGPGGKKYEAPKTNPRLTAHECAPNFNQLAKSQGTTHFVYLTGFDNKEFECWIRLEKYGETVCNNKPCKIYFLDSPQVKVGSGSSPIDAATLKAHGIGLYKNDGDFWEIKGANIWKRSPGFGYYNTNNQLGG